MNLVRKQNPTRGTQSERDCVVGSRRPSGRSGLAAAALPALATVDLLIVSGCFLLSYTLRFDDGFLALREASTPAIDLYVRKGQRFVSRLVFRLWREGDYEQGLRGSSLAIHNTRVLVVSGFYALTTLMVISFCSQYRELLLSRQVLPHDGRHELRRHDWRAVDLPLRRPASGQPWLRAKARGYRRQTRTAEDFARSIEAPDSLTHVVGHFSVDAEPPRLSHGELRSWATSTTSKTSTGRRRLRQARAGVAQLHGPRGGRDGSVCHRAAELLRAAQRGALHVARLVRRGGVAA